MKYLLSTTAVVLGLGLPSVLLAQTATTATTTEQSATMQAQGGMAGFLTNRGPTDLFASELIGHDVYARRSAAAGTEGQTGSTQSTDAPMTTGQAATNGEAAGQSDGLGAEAYAAQNSDRSNNLALMDPADLEGMDNIGQINEIILSNDGEVRALVIGVGGFLGMGEHDVAVTMDQVSFGASQNSPSEIYVVVTTGVDMLKTSPRYERVSTASNAGGNAAGNTGGNAAMTGTGATAADRTAFIAPKVERDGYNQVAVTEISSEMLVGKAVYGVNEDSVGTIDDLIVDESGAIKNVIIDFGGFLGMGTSQVSVGFEELTILANEGRNDVRVYVDATKEQVQAQPQYRATN